MSSHHISSSTINTSKEVRDSDSYVQPVKLKSNICFYGISENLRCIEITITERVTNILQKHLKLTTKISFFDT